jgi:hypothetical protein
VFAPLTTMSKNNNVNPGQYKVAGRERQGEDINPEKEKVKLQKNAEQPRKGAHKQAKPHR